MTRTLRRREQVVNITFHGVGEPSVPDDLDYWVPEANFKSLLDMIQREDNVRITFDDAYFSDRQIALPALLERSLKAEFFITVGRLGWPGHLSRDEVRVLAQAGMTIGLHGMCHVDWRDLDDAGLHEELVVARQILEEIVSRPVLHVSCPFGSYDRRVLRHIRQAGFDRAYTSDGGRAYSDAWLQPRNTIKRHDGPMTVQRILTGETSGPEAVLRGIKLAIKRWC